MGVMVKNKKNIKGEICLIVINGVFIGWYLI